MRSKTTTLTLESALLEVENRRQLDNYLKNLTSKEVPSFFEAYFFWLDKVQKMSTAELQQKIGIERSYLGHLRAGSKHPGRNKVIALCLAAELSVEETQHALLSTLYARNRRDAILHCIEKRLGVNESNDLLDDYHSPPYMPMTRRLADDPKLSGSGQADHSTWICSRGAGLPRKYPWAPRQPTCRRSSSCSLVSTPSQSVRRCRALAIPTTA